MMILRFLLLMVMFAAGAATATYFGAGHVGLAGAPAAVQSAATIPPQQPAPPAPQFVPHESEPAPRRAVRVIPIVRSESETTGGPAAEQEAHSAQSRACSRAYRLFDAATCSYRHARGGPRRLCKK
jgi:hypothetical protein